MKNKEQIKKWDERNQLKKHLLELKEKGYDVERHLKRIEREEFIDEQESKRTPTFNLIGFGGLLIAAIVVFACIGFFLYIGTESSEPTEYEKIVGEWEDDRFETNWEFTSQKTCRIFGQDTDYNYQLKDNRLYIIFQDSSYNAYVFKYTFEGINNNKLKLEDTDITGEVQQQGDFEIILNRLS